jgi:hypothetical protein
MIEGIAPDPRLPALSVLLGPRAADSLSGAFPGATLDGLRLIWVDYVPGRRLAVLYEAGVRWPDDGVTRERLAVYADLDEAPPQSPTVECEGMSLAVWRFPDDPMLPGLRQATEPGFVRRLLDELSAPPGEIALEQRRYRPARDALVEVTTQPSAGRVVFRPGQGGIAPLARESLAYIKVLRPESAGRLWRAHDLIAERVFVPRCHGARADLGLLVLEPLPGRPLWDQLRTPVGAPPGGEELATLLDRFRDVDLGVPPTSMTADEVESTASLLRAVVPDQSEHVDRFVAALGGDGAQPLITIHGDFHEHQVMVDASGITGLLDLGAAGPGHRVDDLATIAGRLWARGSYRGSEPLLRYANELIESFATMCDPTELHRRIAGVIFLDTNIPFRFQREGWRAEIVRRIALAERYLASGGARP